MQPRGLKFYILGGIIAITCIGGLFPLAAENKITIAQIVNSNNSFTIDLYQELAEDSGNLICSPYNIATALAMANIGARDETAAQIQKALHFDFDQAKTNPALSNLMDTLNKGDKSYQLSLANAVWGQSGYRFQAGFVNTLKKYYHTGLKKVDFRDDAKREEGRQQINKWVAEQTQQKIRDLIKPNVLNELTRMVLTSAIYFKGQWEYPFDEAKTQNMPFYTTMKDQSVISMMYRKDKFKYTENEQAQIIDLSYAGRDLSMMVILPRSSNGLSKLERTLNAQTIRNWVSQLSEQKVEVYLPRFKIEQEIQLNNKLKELGITDAFETGKANFSGITSTEQLSISNVVHKAFIEVNEEGTEAAASTAAIIGITAIPAQEIPIFRADHPFIFLIHHQPTGTILFMGRLTDPK